MPSQSEIADTLTSRPRRADEDYFAVKVLATDEGQVEMTAAMAKQLYRYLLKNDYTDDADQITEAYHEAKKDGSLAELPDELKPYADQVFKLVDSIFSDAQLPDIGDGRKPKPIRLTPTSKRRNSKTFGSGSTARRSIASSSTQMSW